MAEINESPTLDPRLLNDPGMAPVNIPVERTLPAPLGRPDTYIWAIYVFLCIISVIELYSASSREVSARSSFGVLAPVVFHCVRLGLGLAIILYFQSRHYRTIKTFTWFFVAMSVVMMVYVMLFGEIVNGARRSLQLPGIAIQPAEFIKLSAVLVVSMILARSQMKKGGVSDKGMWWSAGAILFFSALIVKQGLTNTLLLMIVSLSMMIIGGVRLKKLAMVLGIYALCGGLFGLYLAFGPHETKTETVVEVNVDDAGRITPYEYQVPVVDEDNRLSTWIARLERFFTGDSIPKYKQPITAENRQEMYALIAQSHCHGVGVFPGNSRETSRLPLAFSDFIFSIIVEDAGLFGAIFVIFLYFCLLGRASGIASRCARAYPALLVIGMALMIVVQAIVHMCINVGIMPVSGQPLPLISKGGTSILTTSIALGIMLSVSRYAAGSRHKRQEIKQELDALPEELRAQNPTQL